MTARIQGVVDFTVKSTDLAVRRMQEMLVATLHHITSVADFTLLADTVGVTFTNAAASPGTANTTTRTVVDFVDAGIDQVRVIVRAENSAAGSVTVRVYDVTDSVSLGDVTVTNAVEQTALSEWATITPTGGDHTLEVRCIGDGAFDPIVYRVTLQGRTLQARA